MNELPEWRYRGGKISLFVRDDRKRNVDYLDFHSER
jgi:hypothetical protein